MNRLNLAILAFFIAIAIAIFIPVLTDIDSEETPEISVTLTEAQAIAMEYANRQYPQTKRESFRITQTELREGRCWFVSLGSYGYNYPAILIILIDSDTGKIIKIEEYNV
ncbi:hypothetical protein [Ammoniphilus sp. 3BR4]|uniref:hypothetical protein n=1 Tax=Ammoniphilus sp. 3BR4 TaxID=3158265 RepID=UPI0034669350